MPLCRKQPVSLLNVAHDFAGPQLYPTQKATPSNSLHLAVAGEERPRLQPGRAGPCAAAPAMLWPAPPAHLAAARRGGRALHAAGRSAATAGAGKWGGSYQWQRGSGAGARQQRGSGVISPNNSSASSRGRPAILLHPAPPAAGLWGGRRCCLAAHQCSVRGGPGATRTAHWQRRAGVGQSCCARCWWVCTL